MLTGKNVTTLLNAITVAAVTQQPLLIIGKPGIGKSEPSFRALLAFVNGDRDAIWRLVCNPGVPPSEVEGAINVRELTRHGVVTNAVVGTPFDPKVCGVLIDEVTRASDALLAALLPILDDRFVAQRTLPTLRVATSNFPFDERNDEHAALADRFGLVLHLADEPVPPTVETYESLIATLSARVDELWRWASPYVPDQNEVAAFRSTIPRDPERRRALFRSCRPLNDMLADLAHAMHERNGSIRRRVSLVAGAMLAHWYDVWKSVDMHSWQRAKTRAIAAPQNAAQAWNEHADRVRDLMPEAYRTAQVGAAAITAMTCGVFHPSLEAFNAWAAHVRSITPGTMLPGKIHPLEAAREAYAVAFLHAAFRVAPSQAEMEKIRATMDHARLLSQESTDARILLTYISACMHVSMTEGAVPMLSRLALSDWPPSDSQVRLIDDILHSQRHAAAHASPHPHATRRMP